MTHVITSTYMCTLALTWLYNDGHTILSYMQMPMISPSMPGMHAFRKRLKHVPCQRLMLPKMETLNHKIAYSMLCMALAWTFLLKGCSSKSSKTTLTKSAKHTWYFPAMYPD